MDEMDEIKKDFIDRLPVRILKIESDIKQCDFKSAYREIHNIKGSAAMLGLDRLVIASKTLEEKLNPEVAAYSELNMSLNDLVVVIHNI